MTTHAHRLCHIALFVCVCATVWRINAVLSTPNSIACAPPGMFGRAPRTHTNAEHAAATLSERDTTTQHSTTLSDNYAAVLREDLRMRKRNAGGGGLIRFEYGMRCVPQHAQCVKVPLYALHHPPPAMNANFMHTHRHFVYSRRYYS